MTPAVAYLRVSTKAQATDKKTGYRRQEQAIRAWAKKNKFKIVQVYKEPFTGTENKRPVFQQMVADLVWNGAKTILVESFDRFTRDVAAGMQLVYYLIAKEIALINCANSSNVTEDVNGDPLQRGTVQFMALIAEIERNLSVYRMRQGRDIKSRELGHRIEGRPPLYTRKFRNRLLRLHRNRSWTQVAQYLNDRNELTHDKKLWTGPKASAIARGGRRKSA